jgi:hypothetical protein
MISCRLKGGLGNMMFQVAAIESAAADNGWRTCYPNALHNLNYLNNEKEHNPGLGHATEYLRIFRNFSFTSAWKPGPRVNERTIPYGHTPGFRWTDDTNYDGFFQSEKWFKPEIVTELFEFSSFVKSKKSAEFKAMYWPGKNSCFIHVRRGERVNGMGRVKAIHPVTTVKYLKEAIDRMGDKDYYIFSDDMDWCEDNVPTGVGTIYSRDKDYVDLYLMSLCRNAIIGPSTFSWWGAWLGEKDRVIAPDPWLLDKTDTNDVIPERWEKIAL